MGVNAKPAASLVLSRSPSGLSVVLMVIAVDVLILGTVGGLLGYFTMVLIAYGGEFLKGYDSVEAVLSLPMGWTAALLSVVVFLLFLRFDRTKQRTLSRNLFRSAVISVASAFVATFSLYLLVFLGSI
jgi:hypothetical protein